MPWISKTELRQLRSAAHEAERTEQLADRERLLILTVVEDVVAEEEGVLKVLEKTDQIMSLICGFMSLRESKIVEALGEPEVVEVALGKLVGGGYIDFQMDAVLGEKIYCPTRAGLRSMG